MKVIVLFALFASCLNALTIQEHALAVANKIHADAVGTSELTSKHASTSEDVFLRRDLATPVNCSASILTSNATLEVYLNATFCPLEGSDKSPISVYLAATFTYLSDKNTGKYCTAIATYFQSLKKCYSPCTDLVATVVPTCQEAYGKTGLSVGGSQLCSSTCQQIFDSSASIASTTFSIVFVALVAMFFM